MLKIYVYGYLNRVQSSRRLEREAQRNAELMWLTERLAPDFKTIAEFRMDNGETIRLVCCVFVMLCRKLNLFTQVFVAIDGSKFKAGNYTTPREISSRSASDIVRWDRVLFAGRIPPVLERILAIEPWPRSNSRAIACRESPFCQRSHISALSVSV